MDKQQLNENGETEIVTIAAHSGMGVPTFENLGLDSPIVDFVENIYYPTRLDYIASKALQGLIAGRSGKDRVKAPKQAVQLAQELTEALDKA